MYKHIEVIVLLLDWLIATVMEMNNSEKKRMKMENENGFSCDPMISQSQQSTKDVGAHDHDDDSAALKSNLNPHVDNNDNNQNENGSRIKPSSSSVVGNHEVDQRLLEPWRYMLGLPGKNVRSQLIDAFQIWLKVPTDKTISMPSSTMAVINSTNPNAVTSTTIVDAIKEIVGDLHTSSLLIDDIEDGSNLRRGQPVAHNIYGLASTMNCANYVYFIALHKCMQLNNQQAMVVFTEELLNLHRGQGHDILWRDSIQCPTTDEYIQMVKDKTGGLFRLAVRLMQCFATEMTSTNFTPLTDKMAVYFQVRDDLINLASTQYHKNKSFCEDLTEGKFSFPIIHSIKETPNDSRLISILKQRTKGMFSFVIFYDHY